MLKTFIKHYLELPSTKKRIVCLGGGVGTAQILKGLQKYDLDLTAVVSMADDGGSAGRLRRAFSVLPSGDIVNCLAALSDEESILNKLFLYRFGGKRYGKDTDLGGQKLGNLIFVALADIYQGNMSQALEHFSRLISSRGKVLPATLGDVNILVKTKKGIEVYGEEKIDTGKYKGQRALEHVYLDPPDIEAYKPTLEAIKEADKIIVGPGDLFTTVLPVLMVPKILKLLKKIKCKKNFIVNIANKPFETSNFKVSDFLRVLKNHLGKDLFDSIVVNMNYKPSIPTNFHYQYVKYDRQNLAEYKNSIIEGDFVNEEFALYHDSDKIAQQLVKI